MSSLGPAPVSIPVETLEAEILARIEIASDPETEDEVLALLAHDPYPSVRRAVAENPVTQLDILDLLTTDEDEGVRFAAAETYTAVCALAGILPASTR